MPQILHEVQARYPGLVVHQVEASVPGQYQQLIDGRLDVGVGRAATARRRSRRCCSARTRSGSWCQPVTGSPGWRTCRSQTWLRSRCCSPRTCRAPEFNQFTVEMCRSAGFTPTVYGGTVESIRAAADRRPGTLPVLRAFLLHRCAPRNHLAAADRPASYYPWSVLWRAADDSGNVRAVVSCAQAMSKRLGWLSTAAVGQAAPSAPSAGAG